MSRPLSSFLVLCIIVCAQARCRCFTDRLMNLAKPDAPCQEPVEQKQMETTFPSSPSDVQYTITYVGDDLVRMYVQGKLISSDYAFPKKRYTLEYTGPCADIIVNVTNFNPRGPPKTGGAGLSLLITHEGDTYGTAQQNSFNYCDAPKCSDASAETVRPLFATGLQEAPEECYTNPENCNFSEWEHAVVSDHMLDRPLCEFVKMGRLGALPLNPIDGEHEYLDEFALKFQLPFCL